MNPPDVRFAADAMLQSLAKWIRLLRGVHSAHRQSGARQIDGAERFLISNIGGVKTSVVVVWEAF